MPKNVVSDTNLFYELADKTVRLEDIKGGDETLCGSPLSLIEIVSKMDEGNFEKRRNVVRAVLESDATYSGPHCLDQKTPRHSI